MSNNIKGKRKARKLALQALYQWHMTNGTPTEIEAQFLTDNDVNKFDVPYFRKLIHGVFQNKNDIELLFVPFLDREIKALNPIEVSVLRLSTFELKECLETPYKVV